MIKASLIGSIIVLCSFSKASAQGLRVIPDDYVYPSSIDTGPFLAQIKGVTVEDQSFVIGLNDGVIQIASFLERAETLLNQSIYENTMFINSVSNGQIFSAIVEMCGSLQEDIQSNCRGHFFDNISIAKNRWVDQQANRALYPENYIPIGHGKDQKVLEKALQSLQNQCLQGCQDTAITDILIYGSRSQYDQVVHSLNVIGPTCLIAVLQNVLKDKLLEYHRNPLDCVGKTGQEAVVCRDLQRDSRVVIQRLLFLTRLIADNDISGYWQSSSDFISAMQAFLKHQEDNLFCNDYILGEERELIFFTAGRQQHYRMKREMDGKYTARIAMEFSADEDYNGEVLPEHVHPHYLTRVRESIDTANPKILGPYGEQLNIVIEDAQTTSICMPKYSIKIKRAGHYSSISAYASDIDSPTTLHEVSHIFGLSDEYIPSHHLGNSCRVSQHNSIMANEAIRWNNVFNTRIDASLLDPSHFYSILYGNCSRRDNVKLFRQCSNLSYQFTYNHDATCLNLKQECETQNVLGRNKNHEITRLQAELRRLNVNGLEEFSFNDDQRIYQPYIDLVNELQQRLRIALTWPDEQPP